MAPAALNKKKKASIFTEFGQTEILAPEKSVGILPQISLGQYFIPAHCLTYWILLSC